MSIVFKDPYGDCAFSCICGAYTLMDSPAKACPECGMKSSGVVDALCIHPDHNASKGCGNPECWKYPKEKSGG